MASRGTRRKLKIIILPTDATFPRAHFDSDSVLGFPAARTYFTGHLRATVFPALIVVVILVQKQIKIIRLFSVFAYLVSVSLVAALLSAYYICIWNPRAANITIDTPTVNAERIMMALQTTGGEYVFDSTTDTTFDNRLTGNGRTVYIIRPQKRYNMSGSTYTRIRRTTGTGPFICWDVEDSFFVTIKNVTS